MNARYTYYSTEELARASTAPNLSTNERIRMLDEIVRREKRNAGDVSVMTPGERLRYAQQSDYRTTRGHLHS